MQRNTHSLNPFRAARGRLNSWAFAVFRLKVYPNYFKQLERSQLEPALALPALRRLASVTGAALVPIVEAYRRSYEATQWRAL
ncbi:hypothetical protein JST97_24230 [bacterium]|nr:hypothetical protein [bacterium]